ncbi:tetratricopeptide repeat protein [Flavobacterium sp.]|uniref:tetratricopeptide repeat protein n=1 Tax=Flavobacterium sp. TaxID=239 RepID=UPI0038FC0DAA
MHKLSKLLLLFIFLKISSVQAQKSGIYTNESKEFDKALSLYKDGQFASSQIIFEKVKLVTTREDLKSDCAFYSAHCAILTNQSNAGVMMERFVDNYPTNIKQNQAFLQLAQYHFAQEEYHKALNWFDKVEEDLLKTNDVEKFNFQKGYCFFTEKNKKEAKNYLNKVVTSTKYSSQAKYYLGFIAYEGNDYNQANKYFDQVSGENKYKEKLSYYQADMNFKQGNFEKAIDLGIIAMTKSSPLEKSELNKIIGESYFNLSQYDKSIPYFSEYKGKRGKWSNTDFYQLGYSYYMQKDYEKAIAQYNKIIGGKDAIAQNAYYQLGESYLKLDKKQQALNAFKNASEMEYNVAIQEDAYYNYAKLSYEIGNSYQSTPGVLIGFLKKYPSNANKSAIERLLIDSYISSKNFKEALTFLEKNKSVENKSAYQKVTFYRGLELYNEGKYKEAADLFEKSIALQKDAVFIARATFWKGESEYNQEYFKNAVLSYKQFLDLTQARDTPEYKNVNYNLAYAYFKIKEYEQASTFFENQISKGKADKVHLYDSYLRLGDCRFVTSKYTSATEAYNKVIELKGIDADYAYFQKAICYGFVSKNDKKIEELNSFLQLYPKSEYRDNALFELGNTYVAEKQQEQAIKTYDQLNAEFKKGSFTSKAILRQGLIYYNSDKDDLAIAKFKKVAADFPKTPEALEAVATARLIYVDNGKVDEYASWVRTLDFVSVTDAELDNDSFDAAEKQYMQNNSKQAMTGFGTYVAKFPNGIHAVKANYYLAQLYYSDGEENKSIPNYEFVIAQSRNEFSEPSLMKLAQIFLKNNNYEKAILVLSRIENEADLPQNKTFAQSNLMKCYYDAKDYENSVVYAEKVLDNPKSDISVKSDAQIIIARSAFKSGDESKARLGYAKLQTIAKGELAAEALYYDAYFKNQDSKFEDSNTAVQKLAKNYSSYKYFGAKGLVLMAKNFYGLKDSFQATYILENVIENFPDFPDVVSEAKTELDAIKSIESKTNSSIQN